MGEAVYKGFRKEELEYQYNPRASVPEYPDLAKKREEESRKVRATFKSWLDIPYGNGPRQVVDIFPAHESGRQVLVYFHGGYWRRGSKNDNCNFVPAFVERGATVVLVEHDLCPQVTLSDIVSQSRSALAWAYRNLSRYGGDPGELFIAGNSAGGHLVAMAIAHDWTKEDLPQDLIKGAATMSGVMDLDMVPHVSVNAEIRMTPEIAHENSPLAHPPLGGCPVLVAVGGAEPEGWKQMSRDYYQFCEEQNVSCEYLEIPKANHFTMSVHLGDPQSPLNQAILRLMHL